MSLEIFQLKVYKNRTKEEETSCYEERMRLRIVLALAPN